MGVLQHHYFIIDIIIIMISLFEENDIFGTNASLTYGLTKVEMTLAIDHA